MNPISLMLVFAAVGFGPDKMTAPRLIELSRGNSAQGSAEFPQSFIWLWRDYDAAKTGQQYEMQEAGKVKPMFRVQIYNRDDGPAN